MLVFLILVAVSTVAVFVAAYRAGYWLYINRRLPLDTGVGGYLAVFLCAMILVGVFVVSGARLTEPERFGFGMLTMALFSAVLLPLGIYRLKKLADLS